MLRGKISEHFSSIGSAVLEELRNKQTDRQKETYHCFSEKDNKIFYFKELIKLFSVWLLFDDKLTWQRPAEHQETEGSQSSGNYSARNRNSG